MGNQRLVTAESVRRGHPDKFCDFVADRILDAHLQQDQKARVAIEVFATAGKIVVAGEVTSNAKVPYKHLVMECICEIGYRKKDLCGDENHLDIDIKIHEQSPDIAQAVGAGDDMGAGDQGIMVGYATDETAAFMPLPVQLAHALCRRVDKLARHTKWLGADGKSQVTVLYENNKPKEVTAVVLSVQHEEDTCPDCLYRTLYEKVIKRTIPEELMGKKIKILINPSGKFTLGGPVADTGLTGRKLAVDQYGPIAHIGGGALSGKEGSKVDRSGAYAARWVAKNIVAAGLASRCEVQIAYAIGYSKPVSVSVDTFGTSMMGEDIIAQAVMDTFDLRPGAIIKALDLQQPIYAPLAAYGHFGRIDVDLLWERTDKKMDLIRAVDKLMR